MSSLNYTTYTSQLANLMVQDPTDANFVTFLPGCIDYAEQRIYREGNFLDTTNFASLNLTPNGSDLIYPTSIGTFLVVDQVYVSTSTISSTAAFPTNVNFTGLQSVSFPFVNAMALPAGFPQFFAPLTATLCDIAPVADLAYYAYILGTIRPTSLSAANSSTFLTQTLPDVFMAASMVFASAYQRDFGATTDDPAKGATWEAQYKTLMQSANVEELRKRFGSSPPAIPPRG